MMLLWLVKSGASCSIFWSMSDSKYRFSPRTGFKCLTSYSPSLPLPAVCWYTFSLVNENEDHRMPEWSYIKEMFGTELIVSWKQRCTDFLKKNPEKLNAYMWDLSSVKAKARRGNARVECLEYNANQSQLEPFRLGMPTFYHLWKNRNPFWQV